MKSSLSAQVQVAPVVTNTMLAHMGQQVTVAHQVILQALLAQGESVLTAEPDLTLYSPIHKSVEEVREEALVPVRVEQQEMAVTVESTEQVAEAVVQEILQALVEMVPTVSSS